MFLPFFCIISTFCDDPSSSGSLSFPLTPASLSLYFFALIHLLINFNIHIKLGHFDKIASPLLFLFFPLFPSVYMSLSFLTIIVTFYELSSRLPRELTCLLLVSISFTHSLIAWQREPSKEEEERKNSLALDIYKRDLMNNQLTPASLTSSTG